MHTKSRAKTKLKRLLLLAVLSLTTIITANASPLETSFFTWEVPDGWTISRDSSGLWQLTAPGANPLIATVTTAHLNTMPEQYLEGTSRLWASLGTVQVLEPWLLNHPKNQAWFIISQKPQAQAGSTTRTAKNLATIKWVRWRNSLLVVSSFTVPADKLDVQKSAIQQLASGLKLKRPKYSETSLLEEIKRTLQANTETTQGLSSLDEVRQNMNIARQDWEPFFAKTTPPIYKAYLAYLEARFDASFAIVNGKELGIDADTINDRLKAVANRREVLRRQLQGY